MYKPLPEDVMTAVQQVSLFDTQYTLQVEDVDLTSEIYQLRPGTQTKICPAGDGLVESNRPDVVIVPNGTIQELGVVYRVARSSEDPDGHL